MFDLKCNNLQCSSKRFPSLVKLASQHLHEHNLNKPTIKSHCRTNKNTQLHFCVTLPASGFAFENVKHTCRHMNHSVTRESTVLVLSPIRNSTRATVPMMKSVAI